ncbi:oligosaccharyl transferase subunit beta [Aulographum hederae CBS 113979]|uniref:Dolichyl-diphosphooligosaccharide--protein glycosyltransferase subunit WBP1 n=1 Tax=Aulographum hederae CBS 113979 TaxID=1176131 RepID=A0A6G1GX81_9PEZI|nr:oligosaccharyl transferase subunit beta [Aulographum hederae CBS 113979]
MQWLLSLLLLGLVSIVSASSSSGSKLLVVLDDTAEKDSYSQFWGDLEEKGFKITYSSPKSDSVNLFKHGERDYDHILLFPPKSKGYGSNLTPNHILDFMKAEGNILLALSADSPTPGAISSLLLELDIHLPADKNALVVDHFNYDTTSSPEQHDVLLVKQPRSPRKDIRSYFGGEGVLAVPRAVGHVLGNASPLLAPILRAPSTAYSYNPKSDTEGIEDLFASGEQISLVSAFQARNSARFVVLGSIEMLKNKWFDGKVKTLGGKDQKTANKEFAKQLSGWAFKELGVLKVGRLEHYLNEEDKPPGVNGTAVGHSELNPKIYRIKNKVTYTIELSEYTSTHYTPFIPPAGDSLQLEFTMLSPFHRLPLSAVSTTANSTIYSTTFVTPDQHGIFNFRVNYKRPFLTNVDEKRTVTVRHFAHNEWPRSWRISGAWVWIAGIWVTVGGWVAFVAIWLWSEPVKEKGFKKTQ